MQKYILPLALLLIAAAASAAQQTVLITGANRGIGYEFVQQYADKGYRVIATCRNPDKAEELNAFAAEHDNVVVEYLDLQDLDGIDKLAAKYDGQPVDILINNGALMRGGKGQAFGTIDYDAFDTFFHINVRGPLKVTESFWPHLQASDDGAVATLTTSQGRAGIPAPGFAYYKSSKAAIDNLQLDIGRKGKKDGVRVMILMPGRVATHGEKPNDFFTPIDQSVTGMISVIDNHSIDQNGDTFSWNEDPREPATDTVSEASPY
ncbi:MAG: SDR family NAD(P)-dependent oxidoreductase [Gammaproteobacteria bacterium]|nr:SDR family NAD(P)-dependent oxidoreductase [Gammaproteobacteria bacterium]